MVEPAGFCYDDQWGCWRAVGCTLGATVRAGDHVTFTELAPPNIEVKVVGPIRRGRFNTKWWSAPVKVLQW